MNTLDILLAIVLLFGLVRGFLKGFFVEITSLLALVLGVYGAIHFSYIIARYLDNKLEWSEKAIQLAAFAATFVIIVLAISLLGKLLTKVADTASLGLMNKAFGAAFGLIKFALILSVVLIIFAKLNKTLPFVNEESLSESILYQPVKDLVPRLFPSILKVDDEEDPGQQQQEHQTI